MSELSEALERAFFEAQAKGPQGPSDLTTSDGVWVVWHTDWHAIVDGIFDSEIEARRFADSGHYQSMSRVGFFPFGEWNPWEEEQTSE